MAIYHDILGNLKALFTSSYIFLACPLASCEDHFDNMQDWQADMYLRREEFLRHTKGVDYQRPT